MKVQNRLAGRKRLFIMQINSLLNQISMNQAPANRQEIKVGTKFESYFSNGVYNGTITITKITPASFFVTHTSKCGLYTGSERREGVNSVIRYIKTGIWKSI